MSRTRLDKPSASKTQTFNIASAPLRDAWTDFILSRQAKKCTEATLRNYEYILGRFIAWLEGQGVATPQEVNGRHVRAYLATFAQKSDWTLNDIGRAIRTLVRFWHKEGYLPQPVAFDLPKVGERRLPHLTAEQVKQVLSVCTTRERAIVLLMVDSGLRRQEVSNLNRADIDLRTGVVHVRQGKGRKDRITIIGATTRRALLKYWANATNKADDAPAIQTESGERLTGAGLRSLLRRLSKKSGVPLSAHALRRTFATLSVKAGMDLVSLQTLLGHSDISTTRKYVQWINDDLLEAHRRSSPIDNLGHNRKGTNERKEKP